MAPRSSTLVPLLLLLLGGGVVGVWWSLGGGGGDTDGAAVALPGGALPGEGGDARATDEPRGGAPLPAGGGGPDEPVRRLAAGPDATGEESLAATLAPWRGRLEDALTGRPVAGARVHMRHGALEAEVESDAGGAFEIEVPAQGFGTHGGLRVEHGSYVDLRLPELPPFEEAGGVLLRLEPSARLTGRVRPARGTDGATVRAWFWSRGLRERTLTELELDDTGAFAVEDLTPGDYDLAAVGEGVTPAHAVHVRLQPGGAEDVELVGPAPALVAGRVVLQGTEAPVAGAELSLRPRDSSVPGDVLDALERRATSDAGGAFVLAGLAPGEHHLEVRLPWGGVVRQDVRVDRSGERVDHDVRVRAPGRLAGVVVRPDGEGVAGVRVHLAPMAGKGNDKSELRAILDGEASGGAVATSGPDGAFVFEGLPSKGMLLLVAHPPAADGERVAPASVQVPAPPENGLGEPVRIELPAPLRVAGRVLGPDGAGLAGARVELSLVVRGARSGLTAVETDASGAFAFDDAPRGTLVVWARAEGMRPVRVRLAEQQTDVLDLVLEPTPMLGVDGIVVDEFGRGVRGVRVRMALEEGSAALEAMLDDGRGGAARYNARSNAYGRFHVEVRDPGTWVPAILDSAWQVLDVTPRRLEVFDTGAADATVRFVVRRLPDPGHATLRGHATPQGGGVVEELRVRGVGRGLVRIDGESFVVQGLPPGTYRPRIEAKGCVPKRLDSVTLAAGEDHDVGWLDLEIGTRLTVRVRDPLGEPIDGAKVRLRGLPASKGGRGKQAKGFTLKALEAPGTYRAQAVPRAKWVLRVGAPGFQQVVRTVNVQPRDAQAVTVELVPAGASGASPARSPKRSQGR